MLVDNRRQFLWRSDAELLVDIEPAEYDLDILDSHAEFFRQKADQVIRSSPRDRRRGYAHPELVARYAAR